MFTVLVLRLIPYPYMNPTEQIYLNQAIFTIFPTPVAFRCGKWLWEGWGTL